MDPQIKDKVAMAIEYIENKPHIRYYKYMITKRYSPYAIKKELEQLGLSGISEENTKIYFKFCVEPLLKKYHLMPFYADYKNTMMKSKKEHYKYPLNFRLEFSDNKEMQLNFFKFIKEMEVDNQWIKEIYTFFGSAENFPTDEDGNRILTTTYSKRNIDDILVSDKRYLIDKMILEGLSSTRISEYMREECKMPVYEPDISEYKRVYFNFKMKTIEEKVKALAVEKNGLETFLTNTRKNEELTIGEKTTLIQRTQRRIDEIQENIQSLNSSYGESVTGMNEANANNILDMFLDVATRSYKRYVDLDRAKDRDVVASLQKVVQMMGISFDKASQLLSDGKGDGHSQLELLELYQKRNEEVYNEGLEILKKNQQLEEAEQGVVQGLKIEGLDELGLGEVGLSEEEINALETEEGVVE